MIKRSDGHFKGIIIASNWDSEGNIIQVSLLTKTEDEYKIEMNACGNSLVALCQNEVTLIGTLDENGILTVRNISVR